MRVRWSSTWRLYLVASVALSVATGILLHSHLTREARALAGSDAGPQVEVVVAALPVVRGSPLLRGQLALMRFPREFAPPGSFESISSVAGRVALSDFAAGEAVTETRLARVRAGPVASLVPEGLRAFAVPTTLPPAAIAPGDRVDILATYGSGQPHTETVAEGVEVLLVLGPASAGTGSSGGFDLDAEAAGVAPTSTLILLVSPFQQEDLAYARAFSDLAVTIAPP